jgi:hypothetical protein
LRHAPPLLIGLLLLLGACTTAPKGADSGAGGAGGDGAGEGGDGADGGAQDSDGDGFVSDDCAPDDGLAFPGAAERCNGQDDDCDGAPGAWEDDADGDGALDCAACEAAGLYGAVQGVTDLGALNAILDEAVAETRCEYWRSQDLMYLSLDLREDTTVECVYTGARVAIRGGEPEGGALNVEHTWPQSDGADTEPARCDLHHLFPAAVEANERRGNLPFGEVSSGTTWSEGGSSAGRDSGGRSVFEPRDGHKGNVARALLYVGLRYGRSLQSGEQALFLRWHQADPVTAADQERDAGIAAEQGSPNPYVACPGLVDRALGG